MRIALILAGGTGTRLGTGVPKQYRIVGDKMVIQYALDILADSEYIDRIHLVANEMWQEEILANMSSSVADMFCGFSQPGETRQLSILNGLRDIAQSGLNPESVLIHDAARPQLSKALIEACYKALPGHDGVLPVLPMKDTVYYSENGTQITSLMERSKIYAGQAPELFVFEKYLEANNNLSEEQLLTICGSSEPAVLAGMDVVMIPGDERNIKITTKEDLLKFEDFIAGKKGKM